MYRFTRRTVRPSYNLRRNQLRSFYRRHPFASYIVREANRTRTQRVPSLAYLSYRQITNPRRITTRRVQYRSRR